jgi:26S proteasome regulatory subunit N1
MIALGEEVGTEMIFRSFDHFLQFGDVAVKRAISLSMALLNLSNPKIAPCDLLTKLAYESNKEVATNAIFGIGLISSGTNNARVGTALRQLAGYYADDQAILQVVRLAQGMLHMGKVIYNPK